MDPRPNGSVDTHQQTFRRGFSFLNLHRTCELRQLRSANRQRPVAGRDTACDKEIKETIL